MNRFLNWILSLSPYPEMWIRRIFYNIPNLKKIKQTKGTKKNVPINLEVFENIVEHIRNLGINKGDILIVHSSMDELQVTGFSANKYIEMLLDIVGEEGTLVIPAFPQFKNEKELPIYDPKRTICSTGMIPNLFIRYPGVIRSEFPVNSLAAKGKHAEQMMCNNLKGDLAHGKDSAWEYCVNHHAKILFLGPQLHRSCTVVHVAEELMDSDWPIDKWFETKKYLVKRANGEEIITVRLRRQYWSRYVTSHYRSRVFMKHQLSETTRINNINISYISDSKDLVDFLIKRAKKGKLMYLIPKKFWK